MAEIGGPIDSCSIRGRIFSVAADAEGERDLGGFKNEVQPNGNGTARMVKERKPWKMGGLKLSLDDDRADQEFLQEIADSQEFVPITVTLVSGVTYQGNGTITDDLTFNTKDSTAEVSFMGPQALTQQ